MRPRCTAAGPLPAAAKAALLSGLNDVPALRNSCQYKMGATQRGAEFRALVHAPVPKTASLKGQYSISPEMSTIKPVVFIFKPIATASIAASSSQTELTTIKTRVEMPSPSINSLADRVILCSGFAISASAVALFGVRTNKSSPSGWQCVHEASELSSATLAIYDLPMPS